VRGLAYRGVVHAEVAADGADDDLARVEADTDLDQYAFDSSGLLRVPLHRLLHPERCVTGTDSVILVGQRRAEQGHNPVAHHLVDRAFVMVDGLYHSLEDGVKDLPRVLWIAVGQQLHRALEIGEEHGDLLALPLEGAL
jgi:hypothetical protein